MPELRPHGLRAQHAGGQRIDRPGFTLIEILVVVAIIALLITILLPALREARERARTTVCMANLKNALQGALIHNLEGQMRKERVSTNFGWAENSFRVNSSEPEIFTCPTDSDPKPMPAVLVDILPDRGTTGGSGIFNRLHRTGDHWRLDVQDSVDGDSLGFDAGTNEHDVDLVFGYRPQKGAGSTSVRIVEKESGLNFRVRDHRGRTLWPFIGAVPPDEVILPLLWLSYSANAAAGMRNVKGTPITVLEGARPGIFPQALRKGESVIYPADVLAAQEGRGSSLRFRHGSRSGDPRLRGSVFTSGRPVTGVFPDSAYVPRSRMNAGFLDGRVENLHFSQMLPDPDTGQISRSLWIGISRGTEVGY